MPNKGRPVFQKHNVPKYKIYLKEDPERKPLRENGKLMIFRTKYALLQLFKELKKYYLDDELEWSEL